MTQFRDLHSISQMTTGNCCGYEIVFCLFVCWFWVFCLFIYFVYLLLAFVLVCLFCFVFVFIFCFLLIFVLFYFFMVYTTFCDCTKNYILEDRNYSFLFKLACMFAVWWETDWTIIILSVKDKIMWKNNFILYFLSRKVWKTQYNNYYLVHNAKSDSIAILEISSTVHAMQ